MNPVQPEQAPKLDVAYVAHLARLQLSAEEVARLQGQLDHILDHVRRLGELDVAGVEPTAHAVPVQGALRADEVRPGVDHDEAMQNAPAPVDGLFQVPRIIE